MIHMPTRASMRPAVEVDEYETLDDSTPATVVHTVVAPPGTTMIAATNRNKFASVAAVVVPGLAAAFAYGMSLISLSQTLVLWGAVIILHGVFRAVFRWTGNDLLCGAGGAVATIAINAATVAAFYHTMPVLGAFAALLSIYAILAYGIKEEPCTSTNP